MNVRGIVLFCRGSFFHCYWMPTNELLIGCTVFGIMLCEIEAQRKRYASVLLQSRLACRLELSVRVARDGFLVMISVREVKELRSMTSLYSQRAVHFDFRSSRAFIHSVRRSSLNWIEMIFLMWFRSINEVACVISLLSQHPVTTFSLQYQYMRFRDLLGW